MRARTLDVPDRLAAIRRDNPEWESWVGLLEAALHEIEDGHGWQVAVPKPADGLVRAPCLHGVEITLDGRVARRWIRGLLKRAREQREAEAASLGHLKTRRLDGLALLEAAVRQEDARIDELAAAAGADPAALRVLAQIATMPLLQACGRAMAAQVSSAWWEGYCPVCGAWPALAEFRGIERKRWLRCARCGSGWEAAWLRCPFCGELHHDNLGYLAPESGDDAWKIEICRTCKGYVKAMTTVRATPAWAVPLDDLATVHLDLAALDRGYRRPTRPGYEVDVRLRERRSRGLRAWLGLGGKGDPKGLPDGRGGGGMGATR